MHKFVKRHLLPTFAHDGVRANVVLGEDTHWSEALLLPLLSDPETAPRIDIVAAHAYSDSRAAFPPYSERSGPFETANRLGKRIWQTEVSAGDRNITSIRDGLYWARLLHIHLTENRVSGWFYWWGMNHRDTRSGLIRLRLEEKTASPAKRLFTLGQYARFVRPGDQRLEFPASTPEGVFVSAFRSLERNRIALVAINESEEARDFTFTLHGAVVEELTPWRTSAGEDLRALTPLRPDEGLWKAHLEPSSVTTLSGAVKP